MKNIGLNCPTMVHLAIGAILALFAGIGLYSGPCWFWLSGLVVFLINFYLIAILVEAARRAGQIREIKNNILLEKQKVCFEFPHRVWSLFLVFLLLVAVVVGFASMYINQEGVVYTGPTVGEVETTDSSSASSKLLTSRLNAVYYSTVTITTLGFGDFEPATKGARMLVLWQLMTGLELIVGIFALLVARLSDF